MYRVTREMRFCYGHRLLDYEGRCRYLHGHNGRAVVTIEGPRLDARGMLADFGDIKETLGRWIDANLDHHMVLRRDDPLCAVLRAHGQRILELDGNPTAENLARLLFDAAAGFGYPVVEVQFWETDSSVGSYLARPNDTALLQDSSCVFANGAYRPPTAPTHAPTPPS
jgi:6-pyruvoyltetrahydropterin/6-carboxytetrahydropterin synthase